MSVIHRNAEADALLARLSTEQLLDGLQRGKQKLAILEVDQLLLEQESFEEIGHPGRHASKAFVVSMESDRDWQSRHLRSAINDVEQELSKRAKLRGTAAIAREQGK